MKQLRLVVTVFAAGFLSACSSQVPTASQPSIATDSLETAEAYLMRGDDFSEIREYDHAILDYDQAIRLKPDYAKAYTNRGNAYLRTGHLDLAIADFCHGGQNPVGGLVGYCGIATLVGLLVALGVYRSLLRRSRKMALNDDGSSQA